MTPGQQYAKTKEKMLLPSASLSKLLAPEVICFCSFASKKLQGRFEKQLFRERSRNSPDVHQNSFFQKVPRADCSWHVPRECSKNRPLPGTSSLRQDSGPVLFRNRYTSATCPEQGASIGAHVEPLIRRSTTWSCRTPQYRVFQEGNVPGTGLFWNFGQGSGPVLFRNRSISGTFPGHGG